MMYDLQAAPLLGMFSSRFVKYLEYRFFRGSASFNFCFQMILFDRVLFALKLQQLFCRKLYLPSLPQPTTGPFFKT